MTSSSVPQEARVRPCEPALQAPSFYLTQPPPHHPGAEGNKEGIYRSPWPSAGKAGSGGMLDFFKTRLFDWDQSPMPKPEDMPKATPCTWTPANATSSDVADKIVCTWIGHAGCHFQIPVAGSSSGERITVLTDPVLSNRCSPVQFMGPARLQRPPTSVEDMANSRLPHVWPDVLVISHNHYDHLDYNTVKAIISRPNGRPVPHFFCPLGVAKWFHDLGVPKEGVTELDWWSQRVIDLNGTSSDKPRSLKLTCVPAQHFTGRSGRDRNETLWGGWVMETVGASVTRKIYFAGDTAYRKVDRDMVKNGTDHDLTIGNPPCPAFKEIGELLGPFDLSMIPIGAYKPRAFMSAVHVDPMEATHIHKDVKSKRSIAIHWGVFPLAADGPNEPKETLIGALKEASLTTDDFDCMYIGETRAF